VNRRDSSVTRKNGDTESTPLDKSLGAAEKQL
jgi:hypothetical protein